MPMPMGRVTVIPPAYARIRIHAYDYDYAYAHVHAYTYTYALSSSDRYRQEGIGTAIRHSRDWRHRHPSTLTSMPMPLWEPMRHERTPTRGRVSLFGRDRVEARIRHDDAFMVQDPHGFGFSAYSVDSV